jgi:myo-inositol 2-dehydrogenase/D-chiro-inositol 1-dehydrogenase
MTTVAFAGAGFASALHGMAAHACGIRPVAVASRRPERAAERASQMGAKPISYGELPAGADLVVVCTPPARHVEDALRSLRAGAAVLVEKPLAATLADADRLVEAAASGGRVGYGENLAHAPAVTAALAHRPHLGRLGHLDARAMQPAPQWGDFLTEDWGGGVLFDVGPHLLAMVLLLARPARPIAVSARLDGSHDHPVDEHAELTLSFDSGVQAPLVVSWRSGTALWDAQAAGPSGVLRVELLPAPVLELDGEPVALPRPRTDLPDPRLEGLGFVAQLASFAADAAAGREPVMSAVFGREVLDVICAAYASAGAGGRPEALPFAGPRDRTPLQLWRG